MTTPTPIPDFCVSSNADGFDEFLKVLSEYCKTIGYLNGAHRYYGLSSGGLDCGSQAWTTNELTPHAAIALLTAKPLTEGDLIVGNMFECIEAVRLQGGEGHGKIIYIKGEVYECEYEGCITDHLYERHRFWNLSNEMLNRHFKLIEPAQEEKVNAKIDSLTSQLVQPSLKDELKMSDNPKLKNWGEHISTQEESVKGEDEIRTHDTVVCGWNDEGELVYIRTFDVEPSEGIINDIEHKKAVKAFQWVNENLASSRMGDKCFLDLDPTNQTAHLQQQLKEANLLLLNIKNTIELNNIQKVFPETYPQINQFLTRNK